jgi:hypothetical protein
MPGEGVSRCGLRREPTGKDCYQGQCDRQAHEPWGHAERRCHPEEHASQGADDQPPLRSPHYDYRPSSSAESVHSIIPSRRKVYPMIAIAPRPPP